MKTTFTVDRTIEQRWTFDSRDKLDAFLTLYFPERMCSQWAGSYAVDGGELYVSPLAVSEYNVVYFPITFERVAQ
jgi:hypothetical protein